MNVWNKRVNIKNSFSVLNALHDDEVANVCTEAKVLGTRTSLSSPTAECRKAVTVETSSTEEGHDCSSSNSSWEDIESSSSTVDFDQTDCFSEDHKETKLSVCDETELFRKEENSEDFDDKDFSWNFVFTSTPCTKTKSSHSEDSEPKISEESSASAPDVEKLAPSEKDKLEVCFLTTLDDLPKRPEIPVDCFKMPVSPDLKKKLSKCCLADLF